MLIDAHCHFFTRNILSRAVRSGAISDKFEQWAIQMASQSGNKEVEGIAEFLATAMDKTPLDMYNTMKAGYGSDFIAVPMMLDVTYAFTAPNRNRQDLMKETYAPIEKHSSKIHSMVNQLLQNAEKKMDLMSRSVFGFDVFENAYQQQIQDLTEVKQQLPNRIYPFFSIDPRRNDEFSDGILGEIKKYIGNEKTFQGLKLYSSLGYSPTDPILYDDDNGECVYSYCERHRIPITVHCSYEGFSHFLPESMISGDVYYAPAGRCVPVQHIYKDQLVQYQQTIKARNPEDVVQERQLLLNHPMLWRKVLEKFPRLRLNLAHFGGIVETGKYLRGDQSGFWTQYIKDLIQDFPNVYTDLSCYYQNEHSTVKIQEIYDQLYKKSSWKLRRRIMYGSDYFMIALYNNNPSDYIQHFRDAFGKDFRRISENNPAQFLRL